MTSAAFNAVPEKKVRRKELRHLLPVVHARIEVFVCKPMQGLRITRAACTKVALNPPSIGPCSRCLVGQSHVRGRVPRTWPDGSEIVTAILTVGRR